MLDASLEIIYTLDNAIPHEITNEGLLISKGNSLYLIKKLDNPNIQKIGHIPWQGYDCLGRIRLIDRLFKLSIQGAIFAPGIGYLLWNRKGWYVLELNKQQAVKISTPVRGTPMARCLCRANDNSIYLAEYLLNPNRDSVRIFRTKNLFDYEVVFEFPPLSVRHIHALVQDSVVENRLWILTGDFDFESKFYYTDNYFKTIKTLPCLGQRTRATSLWFLGDHKLIWGMDSPLTKSFILEWGPDYSIDPKVVTSIPGPAYYMVTNEEGGIYLGTTAEPGPAVKESNATLWRRSKRKEWKQIGVFPSDMIPQYAIIYFPRGVIPDNFIVFSLRAMKQVDGKLFIAKDNSC